MTEILKLKVRINGDDRAIPSGLSVWGLLEWLELNPSLVVVERNREIVGRERYKETFAAENDVFELVHFVGGG